jgi:hypothetical protein
MAVRQKFGLTSRPEAPNPTKDASGPGTPFDHMTSGPDATGTASPTSVLGPSPNSAQGRSTTPRGATLFHGGMMRPVTTPHMGGRGSLPTSQHHVPGVPVQGQHPLGGVRRSFGPGRGFGKG